MKCIDRVHRTFEYDKFHFLLLFSYNFGVHHLKLNIQIQNGDNDTKRKNHSLTTAPSEHQYICEFRSEL